jgi:putative colanic acid biosynthesis UDP-glucose lipid carrier transferase
MRNNDRTNSLIKWSVIILDFVVLNLLIWIFAKWHPTVMQWTGDKRSIFFLVCNLTMMVSEFKFYTVIHQRRVVSSDILKRIIALTMFHVLLAYLILKIIDYQMPVGWVLLVLDTILFVVLFIIRIFERWGVKRYRSSGGNFRTVTLVGADKELLNIFDKLTHDATRGFRVLGYYGDKEIDGNNGKIQCIGSISDLLSNLHHPDNLKIGDDMYVCLSRLEADTIKRISRMCEETVTRFFYVPVSVETIGLPLKRDFLDDIEIFTTFENPLQNPVNRVIKRALDLVISSGMLLCMLPFLPIIAYKIKKQSPKGPVFFKQPRTGLDGKKFYCYKFRSMHPNKDESGTVQAMKDDPRKFPFGDFMRRKSIDELPQFWNVFKGDMSIVGPRPHPVALNEEYVKLIDKYMVRHFVKPGVTGYAQVTGFRGETEELWQMEGRVKRDIWYMEHWSFWLDLRILWLTGKQIVKKDEQAY